MKKILLATAVVAFSATAAAEPLNIHPDFSKAYVGILASYLATDTQRPDDYGLGPQFIVGVPINESLNVETNLFGHYLPRRHGNKADLSYGLGADLVLTQHDTKAAIFILAGGGVLREDISRHESIAPFANLGAGVIVATPIKNLSVRAEGRGIFNFNDHAAGAGKVNNILDGRFSLGLQYGFGFKAETVVAAVGDADGDGVADTIDQCPGTPPGTVVDAVGCPAAPGDADGDGVVDTLDQCPATPAGTVVDVTGCPIKLAVINPDEDGDGVPNEIDQCPNTPPNFKVDAVGCLVEQAVALQSVNFEFGADTLTADAKAIVDGIAKSLTMQTNVKVQIDGHTDALGPQAYNLTLSQQRAKAVMAELVANGVAADRLSADGDGEFNPIASNETEAGRAQNRRVEFKIVAQ